MSTVDINKLTKNAKLIENATKHVRTKSEQIEKILERRKLETLDVMRQNKISEESNTDEYYSEGSVIINFGNNDIISEVSE